MAVIFAAAKLDRTAWRNSPFDNRVAALTHHYEVETTPHAKSWAKFDEDTGIGVWALWRDYQDQPFRHVQGEMLLTHFPFGASSLGKGECSANPHAEVIAALRRDPAAALAHLHPPLAALAAGSDGVDIWNDALGLAKLFQLDTPNGTVVGNRPIAMHLLGLKEPKLDDLGWASEQMFGWFLADLTPYRGLSRLPGGSHVSMRASGVTTSRSEVVYDWFTQPPQGTLRDGMIRLRRELRTFADPEVLEIALSGGRDSRASASAFAEASGFDVRFRTNHPPELEAIVARQLIERHPRFSHFDKSQERAYDLQGGLLWRAASPAAAMTDLAERGRRWARSQEGLAASASLYADCPFDGPLPPWDRNPVSIAGVAGEAAKAYFWSPNMVSGVFVRSLRNFLEEISTPIEDRIKTHPLTRIGDHGFADPDHGAPLLERLHQRRAEADKHGVTGYRFLDVWWFTDRFGAGATTGYHLANTVSPFLAPEFLATALQDTVPRRAHAALLDDMIADMMPAWSDVPFFDQIQNAVPREQTRYYRPNTILWEEPHREVFLSIISESPHFDATVRDMIIDRFAADIDPAVKAPVNLKAFGLVHRHYVGELCSEVSALVRRTVG